MFCCFLLDLDLENMQNIFDSVCFLCGFLDLDLEKKHCWFRNSVFFYLLGFVGFGKMFT